MKVHIRALGLVDESASFLLILTRQYATCYTHGRCCVTHMADVVQSRDCFNLQLMTVPCSADLIGGCLNLSLQSHMQAKIAIGLHFGTGSDIVWVLPGCFQSCACSALHHAVRRAACLYGALQLCRAL
jgi:hypothetical protein